jgi:PAS domain S-box-containing protein
VLELRFQHRDGSLRWLEHSCWPCLDSNGRCLGIRGGNRDISARKNLEEALRDSEERYRAWFERSHSVKLLIDPSTGNIVDANSAASRFYGYSNSELLSMKISDINTMSLEAIQQEMAKAFAEERNVFSFEHRLASGEKRFVDVYSSPFVYAGRPLLHSIVFDVTERRRVEQALKASEQELRTLVEALRAAEQRYETLFREMLNGFALYEILFDAEGRPNDYRILAVNPAFERLEGVLQPELVGHTVRELFPSFKSVWTETFAQVVLSGEPASFETMAAGSDKHLEVTVFLPRPGQLACIATDISERKRAAQEREQLQQQLSEASRLESVGTLAGGVAHDFNNLLCGISCCLSMLIEELGEGFVFANELAEMKGLTQRGSELTRQLLGFARRGNYQIMPLDLSELLVETARLFARTRKDLELVINTSPCIVLGDKAQLEHVILNLLVNASQAMPHSGTLTLTSATRELNAQAVEAFDVPPGSYGCVCVADTGVGMSPQTRERIFEPFFTTKAPGAGTGLGLASAFGILKSHSGFITVQSEEGKGSCFSIFLPTTKSEIVPTSTLPVTKALHSERILVVDDEAPILLFCARILKKMGHQVLTARSGSEALELLRAHSVALVILDIIMPGMSCEETVAAIRELCPSPKILLSSGYSIDGQATALLAQGCDGFLAKPFDLAQLSAKLAELL